MLASSISRASMCCSFAERSQSAIRYKCGTFMCRKPFEYPTETSEKDPGSLDALDQYRNVSRNEMSLPQKRIVCDQQ